MERADAGADTEVVGAVEAELSAYMAERRLTGSGVLPADAALAEVLTEFVSRGGARLRARCVWWGWLAAGGPTAGDEAGVPVRLGAALELLQACALIHDDVMDRSETRRGGPAVHAHFAEAHRRAGWSGDAAAYGFAQAVLAGDLALVWAEDLLRTVPMDAAVRRRVEELWQAMRSEMVAGQHLDLRLQAEGSDDPQAALRTAELKSALYSVARPLAVGAVAAGADDRATEVLHEFGRRTGLAFQLRDDLLGVYGDPAQTGKPSGDDIRSGKLTYLTAVAVQLARRSGPPGAEARIRSTLGNPLADETELKAFRGLLRDLGAVRAVEARIAALADEAAALLTTTACLLTPRGIGHLTALARRIGAVAVA
ncbi:polyprenyl synthetase family protein [Actinacidiphila sp. bgisy167]|uniref:polyprenyl synthetase family protein n=1 Tax=Actinacidiphila sp. bgisy167 TaxID=3413797 RepID=UPI003D719610